MVLVDHAAEHFPPPDRQVRRNAGLVVVVGWSLLAGLVRACGQQVLPDELTEPSTQPLMAMHVGTLLHAAVLLGLMWASFGALSQARVRPG